MVGAQVLSGVQQLSAVHWPVVQNLAKMEAASLLATDQQESKPVGSTHPSDVMANEAETLLNKKAYASQK